MQVSGVIETLRADLRANVPAARGLYGLIWSALFADGFQAVTMWRAAHFMFARRWLKPIGRIVGPEAMQFEGWQRLNAEYAQQFGVANPMQKGA